MARFHNTRPSYFGILEYTTVHAVVLSGSFADEVVRVVECVSPGRLRFGEVEGHAEGEHLVDRQVDLVQQQARANDCATASIES